MKAKSLIYSLLFANILLAQEQTGVMKRYNFEVSSERLAELESKGEVEVVEIRLRHPNEPFGEYADYIYGVAGIDLHTLPTAAFIGIGVQDSRGIIAGEGRIKLSLIGPFSSGVNTSVGAGAQAYFSPLKLISDEGKAFEGLYLSGGYDKYTALSPKAGQSSLDSSLNLEIGYDIGRARVGLGRDSMLFKTPNAGKEKLNGFLLKFSFKIPARRRR